MTEGNMARLLVRKGNKMSAAREAVDRDEHMHGRRDAENIQQSGAWL